MASQTITANFTETILLADANDILVVAKNVIGTVDGVGVDARTAVSGRQLTIKGKIEALDNPEPNSASVALDVGGSKSSLDTDTTITIAKTGELKAIDIGINLFSDQSSIVNNGLIGAAFGINGTFDDSVLINNGDILSTTSAVRSLGSDNEIINHGVMKSTEGPTLDLVHGTIRNFGTIQSIGADAAIEIAETGRNILVNHGKILGAELAYVGGGNRDTFVNYNRVVGVIDLGGGDDSFANRGGTVVEAVAGGTGDDSYHAVGRAFTILESTDGGFDTVRSNVNFTLTDFVEKLILTGNGNINGTSGNFASELTGNAGNNRLQTRNGEDVLDGGVGNDVLTGGGSSDRFVFEDGMGKDTINDFDSVDLIDLSNVSAASDLDAVLDQARQQGANVVINFGDGDRLTLRNTDLGDLSEDSFFFFGDSVPS